ncbi:MAG: hypothetical protein GXP58_01065 [Deltaproteobacteria bacterium]|nr:hypothetical protein [Deltaproteobacteria bacterium]
MRKTILLISTIFLLAAVLPVRADSDGKLLDLLKKKGVITSEEAKGLKRELKEEEKEAAVKLPSGLKGVSVGMLGYFDYSAGRAAAAGNKSDSFNKFTLTRGYFTVKKKILPWLGARMTTDIHQESNGDWKTRLKYLYAELKPRGFGMLTNMKAELGLGHIPWLDFEEHVNPYRAQGTMAVERAGIFNSADLGVGIRGNFGGKLEDAGAKTGNRHYDGRFGSWHVGLYDGGGYHAGEKNNNKVLEGRVTLRPLPSVLPGLQLSWFGVYGKGNVAPTGGDVPDYRVSLGMVSYEHPLGIVTAQYFTTRGNAAGDLVGRNNQSLDAAGYSIFGRVKLPVFDRRLALFGRYDRLDPDRDGVISTKGGYDLTDAGLSFDIYRGNMVLLTYETTEYGKDAAGRGKVPVPGTRLGNERRVQVVYQLEY